MSSRRGPRRSRVYGANLDMIESHYKAAMDRLDRSRSSAEEQKETVKVAAAVLHPTTDYNGADYDAELQEARSRASKVIAENTVFDARKYAGLNTVLESEFDEQIQASLNRIRESKKLLSNFDADEALDTIKRQTKAELSQKIAHSNEESQKSSSVSSSRRAIKISSVTENVSNANSQLKWRNETADSFAAKRADATKARLADIESEMQEFEEKQAARARRAAQVKQMLAETKAQDESMSSSAATSRITTGVVKTTRTVKKVVSF